LGSFGFVELSFAFSLDGTKIVAGKSTSISVHEYDADSSELVERAMILDAHAARINSVAFSQIYSSVISGSSDGSIKLLSSFGMSSKVSHLPPRRPLHLQRLHLLGAWISAVSAKTATCAAVPSSAKESRRDAAEGFD